MATSTTNVIQSFMHLVMNVAWNHTIAGGQWYVFLHALEQTYTLKNQTYTNMMQ